MKTVTLSTLVADTGETPRTLNSWSDFGILLGERSTERRGRGTRRRYSAEPMYGERKWALLASALAKLRLPLAEIKYLTYGMRLMYEPDGLARRFAPNPEQLEFSQRDVLFEAALAGEPNVLAVVPGRPHDTEQPMPFHTVLLQQKDNEPKSALNNMGALTALLTSDPTAVVLNLSTIFAPLYSNREPVEAETEAD
jgi:hypothetical protein